VATTHIALLRGINVGGKHMLRMERLRTLFEQAGCARVRSYIQSGNVVFEASPNLAKAAAKQVAARILDEDGFTAPVVVRSQRAWATMIQQNPFVGQDDVSKLHVGLLLRRPTPAAVATLNPERSPDDHFHLLGDALYLHCPNGMARTKLTCAYFDKTLDTVCTMRNWKTTLKLAELACG